MANNTLEPLRQCITRASGPRSLFFFFAVVRQVLLGIGMFTHRGQIDPSSRYKVALTWLLTPTQNLPYPLQYHTAEWAKILPSTTVYRINGLLPVLERVPNLIADCLFQGKRKKSARKPQGPKKVTHLLICT